MTSSRKRKILKFIYLKNKIYLTLVTFFQFLIKFNGSCGVKSYLFFLKKNKIYILWNFLIYLEKYYILLNNRLNF